MSKLENGFQTAVLDTAGITFGVVTGGLPEIKIPNELPNTTTNSNTTYESYGDSVLLTIEPFTIECAFEPEHYSECPNWVGVSDTMTFALEGGYGGSIPVKPTSYAPTGFERDGFPTATVTFRPDTGSDGSVGVTITTPV